MAEASNKAAGRSRARTPNVTNLELALYALATLGGIDRSIHLEEVAVRAYELAPGPFRWDLDKYSEYVDKDKVRVTLTDAEKLSYGVLAKGVAPSIRGVSKRTDVWRLTAEGVAWFEKNRERLAGALDQPLPALKKARAERLRRQIQAGPLWAEYLESGTVTSSPYDFADLVECSPDASNEVVQGRLDHIRAQVELLNQADLSEFLKACAEAHADMLKEVSP